MKYKINLFYVCICFLIYISPIKSEEKTITFTLKANGQRVKEYHIINQEFISCIKEIYINENPEPINSKINLTLSNDKENTVKLIFKSTKTNCSEMFKDCEDIESINLLDYDMSSISNFNKMFEGCKSLKSIDLSFLKNAKVENINNMFSGCSELKSLDWSHLNLSSVHTIENLFLNCTKLESINFSYVDLTNIQSLRNLFSNLISLESIDLSNIIIPNLNNVGSMFFNCEQLASIDLSFINNTKIYMMSNMFDGCKALQSIDFSNYRLLSTSSIDMSNMFSNCIALTNANLSNLYVQNSNSFKMNNLFSNCQALLYADLSNVLITGEIEMKNMFSECSVLTSVDFSNFNSNSNKYLDSIFYKCISLESIDLSPLKNIVGLSNSFMGCTNFESITFPDLKNVQNMTNMFSNCDSLLSMDLSNFDFQNLKSMKGMFDSCAELMIVNLENSNLNQVDDMSQMFSYCEGLVSVNFNNVTKSNFINMNQMFYQCDSLMSMDLSDFKSNNIAQLFYKCNTLEEINFSNFITSSISSLEQVFYDCSSLISLNLSSFDTSQVINMKEMFAGCSSLSSLNLSNFNFQKVSNVENMFKGCSELNYVNIYNFLDINGEEQMFEGVKDNLVFCIGNESRALNISKILKENNCTILDCSENYKDNQKKLILEEGNKMTCRHKCNEIYRYELNNECYKECPEDYVPNGDYKCEKTCELIINFITKIDKQCVYLFNSSSFYLGDYELINPNDKLKLYIAEETINDIKSGTLNFLLKNVTNEIKADYIVREKKEIFQITSSYNQNNKEYSNISILHLGECEKILKDYYHIEEYETLIIFKMDNFVEGIKIPIIRYEVFHPNTKAKLELNLCKNIKTIVPVSIDENMLFKYDPTSDYYNDICFPYTTEKETDIVLKDRKNEYNNNNLALCEKNCKMIEYNTTSKSVMCECDPQNRSPLQLDDIINKEKLLNNFIDIKSISNINLLKCYENLFSKGGLINNVGNYIILSIVLIFAVSLLLFIIKGYNLLLDKIKTIIKNRRLVKNQIKINNEIEQEKEKKNENEKEKEKEIDENLIVKNPPKKKVKVKQKKNTVVKEKVSDNLLISSTSIIKIEKSNEIIKINQNNENENKNENKNVLESLNTNIHKSREEQKTEDVSTYNDYELNEFSYKEATNKDKRTFFQLLISIIKTKHLIIFTFFQRNDYNSQIVKICLFFFSFAQYYVINAIFFNDETMHKIYVDEGAFNFIYFIPQIIYSLIISSIINILIKELSLSEKNIVKIKQEKNIEKLNELVPKVMKCLIVKFILFFLFSFLFLAFFWYYISCFGAVYMNTQIILLKDTLISFSLSLVYPFIFYLLFALIRYPSLNKKEKCLNIWFKISKCIT